MKDVLRQPDGKIRTACKFCRQRKKRCSGEMPCASCVNFNRDCCVYERWSSSSASVPKLKEAPVTLATKMSAPWVDQPPATPPTKPCFTSRVVLRQIQNQRTLTDSTTSTPRLDKENDFAANSLLQSPFKPLKASSASSTTPSRKGGSKSKATAVVQDENSPLDFMSSTFPSPVTSPSLALSYHLAGENSPPFDSPTSYMSMPMTPIDAMTRTISLPAFYDRPWTSAMDMALDQSPPLFEGNMVSPLVGGSYSMSKTISLPAHLDAATTWSQPSTPSSLSATSLATTTAADDLTAMLTPSWYPSSSCDQPIFLNGLLPNDADTDTRQLLHDVDALLLEYGSNSGLS